MTKVDIISGFLGAGKTTLIKKLIKEGFNGEKIVLIENEFGEIGIDGGFLKDAGVQINEMNSGCICCSLVGDFGDALKKVIDEYTPDRIIIEPSGVGKLSDVIKAVKDVAEEVDIELNSYVTVVDTLKCKMYIKNFGEFFNNQIENASTIILSRTAKQPQDKLEATVKLIREHNEEATIITTDWEEIDGKQIVSAMEHKNSLLDEMLDEEEVCPECGHHHDHEEHDHHHDHDGECCCEHDHEHEHHHHHDHDGECCCGHDHEHEHHHDHEGECCCGHDHGHEHHHHADEVFTSWGVETAKKYTKDNMSAILDKLANTDEYGMVLRAKGIVPNEDGTWIYYDLTPGEYELREGSPDYTGKICVIGSNIDKDKLAELFMLV